MYSGEKLDYLCGRVVFGGRKRLTLGRKVGLGGREVKIRGAKWYFVVTVSYFGESSGILGERKSYLLREVGFWGRRSGIW